jgi:hypothetical protein
MEMLGHILKYFKSINFHYSKLQNYRQNWEHKSTITQQYLQECHINLHSTKKGKITFEFFTQKSSFLFNILFLQLKLICPFRVKTNKGVEKKKRANNLVYSFTENSKFMHGGVCSNSNTISNWAIINTYLAFKIYILQKYLRFLRH